MKLFIDDLRNPSDVGYKNEEWVVARTFEDAWDIIFDCQPQTISFDHDLGNMDNRDGYELSKWMVDNDSLTEIIFDGEVTIIDNNIITEDFKFMIHSANPIGKRNIEELLKNYYKHKFGVDYEG